ncbi:hypothetical protein Mapa_005277 [Marchantia paleacea]|nr:hypothetical protein Mapa_005277 [Marchantia paleacea]
MVFIFESNDYHQAYWKSWMSLSKSELVLQGEQNEAEEPREMRFGMHTNLFFDFM